MVGEALRPLALLLSTTCIPMTSALANSSADTDTASISGVTQGPTPFIAFVQAKETGVLASLSFTVQPISGSYTRPVSARYSVGYLRQRGYVSGGNYVVPVFGLYAGFANTVALTFNFTDGTQVSGTVSVTTPTYSDPCGILGQAKFTQYRTSTADLRFDYFLLKNYCSPDTPVVVDTDGNVRWSSTANAATQASTFYKGVVYQSDNITGLDRVDLDGTVTKIGDYATSWNVTGFHHNIDKGRDGLIVDVNTSTETESVNLEVNPSTGAVLTEFDLGRIISAAMVAGGDNPSQFVEPVGTDWFHNNSVAYNPADNTLIVSSRENFVIAVDYDVPASGVRAIHWILGDRTKHWAQFPSLRAYALTLVGATQPPIGQHALTVLPSGDLLLFDDGYGSIYQQPPGMTRTYSAGRRYKINTAARTATEDYTYIGAQRQYSYVCGSFYQGPGDMLIDYASEGMGSTLELQGIGPGHSVIFDVKYPETNVCGAGWNALPIHLEDLSY